MDIGTKMVINYNNIIIFMLIKYDKVITQIILCFINVYIKKYDM